jgi:hypothetical protein
LNDYCQLHPDCHRELGNALHAVNVTYNTGKLTLITTEDISNKMEVLRDLHLQKLYEKMYQSFEAAEFRNSQIKEIPKTVRETFKISKELFKLVPGHKKINVRRAKALRGITGNDLTNKCR